MIKKKESVQPELEFVIIEDLVPSDHLLRYIDETIDFNFIYDKVEHLYSTTTGRPAIDPVVIFKMFLIQYMYGIKSECQLMKEIQVNVAYRWFLGFKLTDKIPHSSVFSQNRRRRFTDSSVFQEIFEDIVEQAFKLGFIEGKVLFTDSTHIKANANNRKFESIKVEKKPSEFIDELNEDVNKEREKHNKKRFQEKETKVEEKEIKKSKTDPESGFLTREGKPKGFFYHDHRSVDNRYNLITDVHITPGNVHDSIPYLNRLDYQLKRYAFPVQAVGIDAGYNTSAICKGIIERNIFGVIGRRRFGGKKGYFRKSKFKYINSEDVYICPNNCKLKYKLTMRQGYNVYESNIDDCFVCPLRNKCVTSKTGKKAMTRHVWEHYKEEIMRNNKTELGKSIYKRRKETVERSFANSKQLHGYRYARFIGLEKMRFQAYMTAISQNIKKIAKLLLKPGNKKKIFNFINNLLDLLKNILKNFDISHYKTILT